MAKPTWLIVLQGKVSSVSSTQLTLDLDPHAVAFTDKPQRRAVVRPSGNIVEAFLSQITPGPEAPNAAVTSLTRQGDPQVITLTEVSLEGQCLALMYTEIEGPPPAAGEAVALFVDGFSDADNQIEF